MRFFFAFIGFFLGLFWPLHTQAQQDFDYLVAYEMQLNFSGLTRYDCDLYLGAGSALFTYRAAIGNTREAFFDHVDAVRDPFVFELSDTASYFIYSDRRTDLVQHLEPVPGLLGKCLVLEPMPVFNWLFTGRTKRIMHFDCIEATGSFAGRDYVVWFSRQLPVSFGPWKLHGLPGLILEAHDESYEVVFYAKEIRPVAKDLDLPDLKMVSTGKYPLMDRHAYNNSFRKYLELLEGRMATKFGRGYRVNITSSRIKTIEYYDD